MISLMLMLGLTGCGKEEVVEETTVPVETPAPTPAYVRDTDVTFTYYGDEIFFMTQDNEAIQSYTNRQIILLPDRNNFDTVTIDYIQGTSLNDYGRAYWTGHTDESKTEYAQDAFTTDTMCYNFLRTEKNSYIMITGPVEYETYCLGLRDRFQQ